MPKKDRYIRKTNGVYSRWCGLKPRTKYEKLCIIKRTLNEFAKPVSLRISSEELKKELSQLMKMDNHDKRIYILIN